MLEIERKPQDQPIEIRPSLPAKPPIIPVPIMKRIIPPSRPERPVLKIARSEESQKSHSREPLIEQIVPVEKENRVSRDFMTASEKMSIDNAKSGKANQRVQQNSGGASFAPPIMNGNGGGNGTGNDGGGKRLGQRGVVGNFKSPMLANGENKKNGTKTAIDERLKSIDPLMIEHIENEIMEGVDTVAWDDIAGLDHAKKILTETIVWPMMRPDREIFSLTLSF